MTDNKHLKARVRSRMAKTGERYAAARANVVAAAGRAPRTSAAAAAAGSPIHLAGDDPETTGLRILLAERGIQLSDALALVVGGGVGIGVFAFHYEKERFSSFYLAGRHRWDDALAYLDGAFRRLGLEPQVAEAISPTVAARRLAAALAEGPAIVWVDAVELGTRGHPSEMSGGGYHTLVVHSVDEAAGTALVSDLANRPATLHLETLGRARARISRFKNRVLTVSRADGAAAAAAASPDLPAAIRAGLAAGVRALDEPRTRNFSLAALSDWAHRLRGDGRDSWRRVFAPGEWLWTGLAAIHEHVEHGSAGDGLGRERFAAGLREAADRLGDDRLLEPAGRYEALGTAWSSLAAAALPDAVPALGRTRAAQDRRAAAYRQAGAATEGGPTEEVASAWRELAAIRSEMREAFPLDDAAAAAVRAELAGRVEAIHRDEVAAHESLRRVLGG